MLKKFLASVLLTASTIAVQAGTAEAGEVWYGEFQSGYNVDPPTILNIDMYDGWIWGTSPVTRCENMGGIPHWHWTWHYTCLDVDY